MAEAPYALVQSAGEWRAVVDRLRRAPRLAVDVEADGFHRYPERVALVQIADDSGAVWLVDVLAVDDIGALGELLGDPTVTVVMHAAGYDVRSLHRDHAFGVRGLFDTAVAAQFCGARRTGLGHVVEDWLGVHLDKAKRLQRTDWSARPLPAAALTYAAADVRSLLDLADRLSQRLRELGREQWVAEECERVEAERFRPPEPAEEAMFAVTGARDLSDEERAVLRELVLFREAEARRTGRPPYRIMSGAALLALAVNPKQPLERLAGVDSRVAGAGRVRLQEALRRGRTGPPVPWPCSPRRFVWPRQGQERLRLLKGWRAEQAAVLDLDPGVVWPADHLKQVALHPDLATAGLDRGRALPCVRAWQWQVLGPSLEQFRRESLGDRAVPSDGPPA